MKLEDALLKAMNQSLANAEQWMKDAKLLMDKGSLVHGSVLRDIAGEEIAKAFACWRVLIGAIPMNHPLVRPNKKITIQTIMDKLKAEAERDAERIKDGKKPKKDISVFSSHSAKNTLLTELASVMFRAGLQNLGINDSGVKSIQLEQLIAGLKVSSGEIGAYRRTEWMYVDFVKENDNYEVSSPMEKDLNIIDRNLTIQEGMLETLKSMIQAPKKEIDDAALSERAEREKNDPYLPDRPRWIKSDFLAN